MCSKVPSSPCGKPRRILLSILLVLDQKDLNVSQECKLIQLKVATQVLGSAPEPPVFDMQLAAATAVAVATSSAID